MQPCSVEALKSSGVRIEGASELLQLMKEAQVEEVATPLREASMQLPGGVVSARKWAGAVHKGHSEGKRQSFGAISHGFAPVLAGICSAFGRLRQEEAGVGAVLRAIQQGRVLEQHRDATGGGAHPGGHCAEPSVDGLGLRKAFGGSAGAAGGRHGAALRGGVAPNGGGGGEHQGGLRGGGEAEGALAGDPGREGERDGEVLGGEGGGAKVVRQAAALRGLQKSGLRAELRGGNQATTLGVTGKDAQGAPTAFYGDSRGERAVES